MKNDVLFEIKDLHVSIEDKEVLRGISLKINEGEIHAIFGPNGSGKTTLLNSIMGFEGYKATGEILFRGKNIIDLPVDERARLGLGISFQRPPAIPGVRLGRLIQSTAGTNGKLMEGYASKLNLVDFLERGVNVGFSGGEIKRAELLQLILQDPDMILLDEPESGVDLENIALIGEYTNHMFGRKMSRDSDKTLKEIHKINRKSGLIITHTGHILNYVDVDVGHILMEGRMTCKANPREMLHTISECGFSECYRCFQKE